MRSEHEDDAGEEDDADVGADGEGEGASAAAEQALVAAESCAAYGFEAPYQAERGGGERAGGSTVLGKRQPKPSRLRRESEDSSHTAKRLTAPALAPTVAPRPQTSGGRHGGARMRPGGE